MEKLTKALMTDETGQAIVTKLNALSGQMHELAMATRGSAILFESESDISVLGDGGYLAVYVGSTNPLVISGWTGDNSLVTGHLYYLVKSGTAVASRDLGEYGGTAVTSTTFDKPGVPADDFAVGEALADKADSADVTALTTVVAGKADSADVTALDTRVTAVEGNVDALAEKLTALSDDIAPFLNVDGIATPTLADKLNFPANGTAYATNNSYDVYYIPVYADYTYVWQITEQGAKNIGVRFAFSANLPANGVAGTFIETVTIATSATGGITYTPTSNGYLAFAVWGGDATASDCSITVTHQGVKEDIEEITTALNTLEANVDSLTNTVDGIDAVTMTPALVDGIIFAEGATAYSKSSSHDTYYIPVVANKSYTWVLTKASGTNPYCRYAFATVVPAIGVSGAQISETIHVLTTDTFVYTPSSDGYISMSVYDNNMPLANQTVTCNRQQGLTDRVKELEEELESVISETNITPTNRRALYFTEETLAQDNTQVKLSEPIIVPHNGVELAITCPDNICVYFDLIVSAYDSTSTTTGYYGNGDTVTFTEDYDLYKIHFAYCSKSGDTYTLTGETLPLSTVVDLIDSNMIRIDYEGESVIINSKDIEKKLWSAIANADIVLSHISDTHADAIRYDNFLEMSKYIGVDVAINSGDAVNQNPSNGCKYLEHGIAEYPDLSTIFCFGNHDAYATNALNANAYINPFNTAYEYEVATDGTYYYKDYADKSIRIIVLNIYEERRAQSFSCRISQTQIEWFISTLASTPSGYGVIVVTHSMENYIGKVTGYDAFYDDDVTDDWCCRFSGITGYPVRDIIDAFIAKTTTSGTYTQNVLTAVGETTIETETVTYSADFTSVDASCEFIASINGHKHYDMVGYINGATNTQLNLNITHGVASHYYADQSETPRADGKGSVQDAFNIYAVDRTSKVVKVFRIGSNVTYDMTMREYMAIPYTE